MFSWHLSIDFFYKIKEHRVAHKPMKGMISMLNKNYEILCKLNLTQNNIIILIIISPLVIPHAFLTEVREWNIIAGTFVTTTDLQVKMCIRDSYKVHPMHHKPWTGNNIQCLDYKWFPVLRMPASDSQFGGDFHVHGAYVRSLPGVSFGNILTPW